MSTKAATQIGLGVVALLAFAYMKISSDRARKDSGTGPSPHTMRLRAAADEARVRDSVEVAAQLRRPISEVDPLKVDRMIHGLTFVQPHDAIHVLAVERALDSAAYLTRTPSERIGNGPVAANLLSAMRDPLDARQVARRNRMQAVIAADRAKIAAAAGIVSRKAFTSGYEQRLLDAGLDVTVTTRGKDATTLHLKYILVGRVFVNELGKQTDLFMKVRELGFTKFQVSDGYDLSWSWDFTK